ncbi:hypothetical protein BC567DRAFT_253437 [Phyllosticta citribraziliensis]
MLAAAGATRAVLCVAAGDMVFLLDQVLLRPPALLFNLTSTLNVHVDLHLRNTTLPSLQHSLSFSESPMLRLAFVVGPLICGLLVLPQNHRVSITSSAKRYASAAKVFVLD